MVWVRFTHDINLNIDSAQSPSKSPHGHDKPDCFRQPPQKLIHTVFPVLCAVLLAKRAKQPQLTTYLLYDDTSPHCNIHTHAYLARHLPVFSFWRTVAVVLVLGRRHLKSRRLWVRVFGALRSALSVFMCDVRIGPARACIFIYGLLLFGGFWGVGVGWRTLDTPIGPLRR
jgi:hypothetical protein